MKSIRKHEPKDLTQRTSDIVRYVFDNPSATQKQIAAAFSLSPQRISQILGSQRVLAAFPLIARTRRKSLIPKAVQVERQLLESENDEVRRKVVASVYQDHKISDPQPSVQVNVFQTLPESELKSMLGAPSVKVDAIDAEIVDTPPPADTRTA
jgi:hypothetical protein